MKAQRLNLCTSIRLSILALGFSTVKVVNAVNAELGKLGVKEQESKTGASRVTGKGTEFAVSTGTTTKYHGKLTMPLYFDAWCSAVAKAEKIAPFKSIEIPAPFQQWMAKFAKAKAEEIKAESELTVDAEESMAVTLAEVQPAK